MQDDLLEIGLVSTGQKFSLVQDERIMLIKFIGPGLRATHVQNTFKLGNQVSSDRLVRNIQRDGVIQ